MNISTVIKRAQDQAAKIRILRKEPRFLLVMGFLSAKGLLIGADVPPLPSVKVSIADAIWAGTEVEPRILEVLPAALIAFPRSFIGRQHLPPDLARIVAAIRRGWAPETSFGGIQVVKMLEAARRPLRDRRAKAVGQKKVPKTFRLDPEICARLTRLAAARHVSATALLEELIKNCE